MLTSFFGNSRPINYVVLTLVLVGAMGVYQWMTIPPEIALASLGIMFLQWLVLAFTIFLFDFLLRKNALTKSNTYAGLILVIFFLSFPNLMRDTALLWSQVFVLLAMRRIFSLQSPHRTRKKIFDAALWITLASLFYFWSILFLLVLYVALVKRANIHYKMLLMPPVGVAAVLVISTAIQYIVYDALPWFVNWGPTVDSSFAAYNNITWVLPAGVLLVLLLWTLGYRSFRMSKVSKKELPNYQLVHHWMLVALGVIVLAGERTGTEILLLVPPVAIGITNFIERIEERWFRELLLVLLLLLPIARYLF